MQPRSQARRSCCDTSRGKTVAWPGRRPLNKRGLAHALRVGFLRRLYILVVPPTIACCIARHGFAQSLGTLEIGASGRRDLTPWCRVRGAKGTLEAESLGVYQVFCPNVQPHDNALV